MHWIGKLQIKKIPMPYMVGSLWWTTKLYSHICTFIFIDASTTHLAEHLKFIQPNAGNYFTTSYKAHHLDKSKDWIFSILLTTHLRNIWCNMLSRICRSIGRQFKCLSIRWLDKLLLLKASIPVLGELEHFKIKCQQRF